MPGYYTDEERVAWAIAESLLEKARAMMVNAENALEAFKVGKEINRRRCAARGISTTDAEIRYASTAPAKNALTDNAFHAGLAAMYFGAANTYYSRAIYLRSRSAAPAGAAAGAARE